MRLSDSLKQLGRPVVFYPRLADVFGIPESIFISHFVYWSDKGIDPEGWIYKSIEEITEETGLSYEQQRRIRRELTAAAKGAKGRKLRRRFPDPILEERYDRTAHLMYFRIDFEALDRAFSQGQLFPVMGGHLDNVQVPVRERPSGSWTLSKSSISKSTTESTTKKIYVRDARAVGKSTHAEFVRWWDDNAKKVRGESPDWEPADFRNLKLALRTVPLPRLEQMGLYYLADPKFRSFVPSMRTFLSAGVFRALADEQNREGFWGRLDSYASQYLHYDEGRYTHDEKFEVDLAKLTEAFKMKK